MWCDALVCCHVLMAQKITALRETNYQDSGLKVDRENCVIRGVKLLGEVSKNGRRYLQEAYTKASKLYEGLPINVDHHRDRASDRPVQDRFGLVENVRVKPGGLYGDVRYLQSHPLTEMILEAAEKMPRLIGMSQDAEGIVDRMGGELVVTEITEVRSVDLVAEPATTNGLFESERKPMKVTIRECAKAGAKSAGAKLLEMAMQADPAIADVPVEMEEVEGGEMPSGDDQVAMAFRAMILGVIDDPNLDIAGKKAKLGQLLAMQEKAAAVVSGGGDSPSETTEAEGEESSSEDDAEMKKTVESLERKVNELASLIEGRSLAFEIDSILASYGANRASLNESQSRLLDRVKTADEARDLCESWDLKESKAWPRTVAGGRAETGSYDEILKGSSLVTHSAGYRSGN